MESQIRARSFHVAHRSKSGVLAVRRTRSSEVIARMVDRFKNKWSRRVASAVDRTRLRLITLSHRRRDKRPIARKGGMTARSLKRKTGGKAVFLDVRSPERSGHAERSN